VVADTELLVNQFASVSRSPHGPRTRSRHRTHRREGPFARVARCVVDPQPPKASLPPRTHVVRPRNLSHSTDVNYLEHVIAGAVLGRTLRRRPMSSRCAEQPGRAGVARPQGLPGLDRRLLIRANEDVSLPGPAREPAHRGSGSEWPVPGSADRWAVASCGIVTA
jgi:hypothetical protein